MIKLFIMNGPDKGRSFDFQGDSIHVGRSPENDVQLKDRSVSRSHLKILRKAGKYFIKDLETTNGTYVKRKRINGGKEFNVEEGAPIAVGRIVVSLGKGYSGNVLAILDSIDLFKDLSENASLLVQDRPMTRQKNMGLISKVSDLLMQSLDINEILQQILNYILNLLQRLDRGVIILINSETGKITEEIYIIKEGRENSVMMYSKSIVERVIREGKPVIISNTEKEDIADISESMELMKVRSVICVPLISRSKIRGLIYLDSIGEPFGFREDDLHLLTALSSPAAVAIENDWLYSSLEKIVEDRTEVLTRKKKP